jgi:hypothetical protein
MDVVPKQFKKVLYLKVESRVGYDSNVPLDISSGCVIGILTTAELLAHSFPGCLQPFPEIAYPRSLVGANKSW